MIHKHDNTLPQIIACRILHQKVYFLGEVTIDLDTSESFQLNSDELPRKMQEISHQNIATRAFALEMGDKYYIQRILIIDYKEKE